MGRVEALRGDGGAVAFFGVRDELLFSFRVIPL
jgi:hypothetical protein